MRNLGGVSVHEGKSWRRVPGYPWVAKAQRSNSIQRCRRERWRDGGMAAGSGMCGRVSWLRYMPEATGRQGWLGRHYL